MVFRFRAILTVAYAAGSACLSVPAAAQMCSDILKPALMTVSRSGQSSQAASAFTAWQCGKSFSSHDEAINAGIDVGVPVYGVPVKVGGTFASHDVDSWRSQNCSQSALKTTSEDATASFLMQIAPGVAKEWGRCMAAHYETTPVACEMTPGATPAFKARWRRSGGELDSAVPRVSRFTVANGSCEPLPQGKEVSDGGIGTLCTPLPHKAITVLLETTRGACDPLGGGDVAPSTVISGKMVLDKDQTIIADTVKFQAGAEIVTNGNYLAIQATTIQIDGDTRIIAFEPRGGRPAGDRGRSGGAIVIQADEIAGARLVIDPSGEDGVKGDDGAPGRTGNAGQDGKGGHVVGIYGCRDRRQAGTGETGLPGSDGKPGGAGGDGGVVTIRIAAGLHDGAITRVAVVTGPGGRTRPGKGGAPGAMGQGGDGGNGGSRGDGHDGCAGVGQGTKGLKGSDGKPGEPGKDGKPGAADIS